MSDDNDEAMRLMKEAMRNPRTLSDEEMLAHITRRRWLAPRDDEPVDVVEAAPPPPPPAVDNGKPKRGRPPKRPPPPPPYRYAFAFARDRPIYLELRQRLGSKAGIAKRRAVGHPTRDVVLATAIAILEQRRRKYGPGTTVHGLAREVWAQLNRKIDRKQGCSYSNVWKVLASTGAFGKHRG